MNINTNLNRIFDHFSEPEKNVWLYQIQDLETLLKDKKAILSEQLEQSRCGCDSAFLKASIENLKKDILETGQKIEQRKKPIYSPPRLIVETILEILHERQFEYALDPWADTGLLLTSLVESGIAKKGLGICLRPQDFEFAQNLSKGLDIDWKQAGPLNWIQKTTDQFDLIVCYPPLGLKSGNPEQKQIPADGIQDTDDALLILNSCQKLKPEGIGIFIVPKRFVRPDLRNGVYANLNKFGLTVDALLSLPAGSFEPTTSIGGDLIIIKKSKPDLIFTGRLLSDETQRRKTIDNLKKRRRDTDIIYGALVKPDTFRGFEALELQDRINRISKKFGYPPHSLGEIVSDISHVKNDDSLNTVFENTIYLSRLGTSPAVTKVAEFTLKPTNYLRLALDPEKADADYVAGLLNSPFGRTLRERGFRGTAMPNLTKTSIEEIVIFLPPLTDQKKIVEADLRVKAVEVDLNNIRDKIWSEPRQLSSILPKLDRLTREESLKEWLEGLPFPLASILGAYIAAGSDEKQRYEHLLHFFEATASFMATINLSAAKSDDLMRKEVIPELMSRLQTQHIGLTRASFGTWQTIYSNLAKTLRDMKVNPESREQVFQLFKTHDSDVFAMLTSRELSTLFEQVNSLRNLWTGHGGVVSQREAASRHNVLKKHLQTLQQIFGSSWDRYQLVAPMELRISNGKIQQNVQCVTGKAAPFEQTNLDLEMGLDTAYLYLVGLGEREAMQLLPFVRLSASPQNEMNACYFFNRKGNQGFRFVSYHFASNSEIEEPFPDVASALHDLLGSFENGNRLENGSG